MVSQTHCYSEANGGGPKRVVADAVDKDGVFSTVGSSYAMNRLGKMNSSFLHFSH
jgi:hypothetical protein